jgi:hypothetical protein
MLNNLLYVLESGLNNLLTGCPLIIILTIIYPTLRLYISVYGYLYLMKIGRKVLFLESLALVRGGCGNTESGSRDLDVWMKALSYGVGQEDL